MRAPAVPREVAAHELGTVWGVTHTLRRAAPDSDRAARQWAAGTETQAQPARKVSRLILSDRMTATRVNTKVDMSQVGGGGPRQADHAPSHVASQGGQTLATNRDLHKSRALQLQASSWPSAAASKPLPTPNSALCAHPGSLDCSSVGLGWGILEV